VEFWVIQYKELKVPRDVIFEMERITTSYIQNRTDNYMCKLYFKYKLEFQVSDAGRAMIAR